MKTVVGDEAQLKLAICGCGKLHFSYGALTLHFSRQSFVLFAESVAQLGAMVKQTVQGSALPPDVGPKENICH